jgi:hypothetical protein
MDKRRAVTERNSAQLKHWGSINSRIVLFPDFIIMPFNNLGIFTFLLLSVPSNSTKRKDSLKIEFQDCTKSAVTLTQLFDNCKLISEGVCFQNQSQWPLACWECGFESRRSLDACLLWTFVFSGTGLCDGLITRPEDSFRVWCVWVWSRNLNDEEVLTHQDCRALKKEYLERQMPFLAKSVQVAHTMLCIVLNNCAHNVQQKLSITCPVYNGKVSVSQVSSLP